MRALREKICFLSILFFVILGASGCGPKRAPETESEATTAFTGSPERIEEAAKCVVKLEVFDESEKRIAVGSGFYAVGEGYLITSAHVVKHMAYAVVTEDDGQSFRIDGLIAVDDVADVAVLDLGEQVRDTFLPIGETLPLRGENVAVIGTTAGFINLVTLGNVSRIDDYGKITLRESAGGSYVSVDGTTHYTIAKGAWEQYTCTKCGHVKTEEVKGFIDYPPRITLSALNAAGYRTVGDVINAGPSTFGRYFESVGEFMTESGATVDVAVPGSHAVTGFHYFDNEKSEFVTKEQFLEIVGGEDAVLTNGIGLSFVVTFYPSDSSYFVAPMEADMNFYY